MAKPDGYLTILEAPLDPYSVPDQGDGGIRSLDAVPAEMTTKQRRAAETAPTPIVPYTRPIRLGTVGKDVLGAKRAIWKGLGLGIPKGATRVFGPVAVSNLKKFQAANGLVADGVLGPNTLRKLAPFFDAYAFLLFTGYPPGSSPRRRMVAYAIWGYNNRVEIHYSETRPMTYLDDLQHLPVSEDCSAFATKVYKFAGVPDPNGNGYDGGGYTGTLRQHGKVVALANAQPGDLVFYSDPDHVAVYVGNGRVISLGSEIGPLLCAVDYRPVTEIRAYE